MTSESNNRIAKNTMLLYIRMLLIMVVTLYTSRIVLNSLGVEDFGIYSIVGGIASMFGFLNSSMASATQRFFSFELGKKDYKQLGRVFSMSVNIHFVIAFAVFVIAETIGLWVVNTQLILPPERMLAANWVYQFSVLAFIITIISVPYNAVIIAHERMNVFAMVSIVEVSLKLISVFLLQWYGYDKLKLYAVLIFAVSLIVRLIYGIYCNKNFPESKYHFEIDKPLFKTLFNFASWSLWINAATTMFSQGLNILINIFFGPTVNAALGIAYQVRAAVYSFSQNFQMAMNPQIIKSFASNDLVYMHQLIFKGAKFSFFLLFSLSLPFLLDTELILKFWLKIVPQYSVIFTQLVIVNVLIDCISGPLVTAAQASGKIKLYQGVVGGLLFLILPISYLFLLYGYPPQVTLYVSISISISLLIARLFILRKLVQLKIKDYLAEVILKALLVSSIGIIMPLVIHNILDKTLYRFIIVGISGAISVMIAMYFVGLNISEKLFLINVIKKYALRLKINI